MSVKKQLGLFLIICLPVTWVLTGIPGVVLKDAYLTSPVAYALSMAASFMPAITAVICKLLSKERIRSLNFLPKIEGNGKNYAFAVLGALFISIWDTPLVVLLFFPEAGSLHPDATVPVIIFGLLLYTAVGAVQFFVLMGEEVGWMGFLFPKFEELFGTNAALVLTGVVRGLWHVGMLVNNENFVRNFLVLCISNIILGSLLVLLTKKSGSVVPAALCHALNNTIPAVMLNFMVMDEVVYEQHEMLINIIMYVPYLVFAGACWYVLMKKYRMVKNNIV